MVAASDNLLAFEVMIDGMRGVCFASSIAKARWLAVKAYREAGWGKRGKWPRVIAARAPRFDQSPLRAKGARAWAPSYVEAYQ